MATSDPRVVALKLTNLLDEAGVNVAPSAVDQMARTLIDLIAPRSFGPAGRAEAAKRFGSGS